MGQREKHTPQLKKKVAVEALKERKTTSQIASQFDVHSAQVSAWKKQALDILGEGFKGPAARKSEGEFTEEMSYSQIGQIKVELDCLKKNLDYRIDRRRSLIDPGNNQISIARPCDLVGLNRSSYYYDAAPVSAEDPYMMRIIDELYLDYLFLGSRRMAEIIGRQLDCEVNRKRMQRLMRTMGIQGIYPMPNTSKANCSLALESTRASSSMTRKCSLALFLTRRSCRRRPCIRTCILSFQVGQFKRQRVHGTDSKRSFNLIGCRLRLESQKFR